MDIIVYMLPAATDHQASTAWNARVALEPRAPPCLPPHMHFPMLLANTNLPYSWALLATACMRTEACMQDAHAAAGEQGLPPHAMP